MPSTPVTAAGTIVTNVSNAGSLTELNRCIAVSAFCLVSDADANTVQWKDGNGTPKVLTGGALLNAGQQFQGNPLPCDPVGNKQYLFSTGPGENLVLTATHGINGYVIWDLVPPGSPGLNDVQSVQT